MVCSKTANEKVQNNCSRCYQETLNMMVNRRERRADSNVCLSAFEDYLTLEGQRQCEAPVRLMSLGVN